MPQANNPWDLKISVMLALLPLGHTNPNKSRTGLSHHTLASPNHYLLHLTLYSPPLPNHSDTPTG